MSGTVVAQPGDGPVIARDLAALRLRAEECHRSEDDAGLLTLRADLETDGELWAHLWAPFSAIAAARLGRADARAILDAAIAGGFSQPDMFDGKLEELFGSEPDWPALAERMRTNTPPPTVELLEWPDPAPTHPLRLERLAPDRERLLRDRLPTPGTSAWETARTLLAWVSGRWKHANDHVDRPDALEVLDRVDAGERFACTEYAIVLTQALNAVGVPARRLHLRQPHHHVGFGRGHVVSEAWIDDLGRWVLLDGQHGAYWSDADDEPLGLPELRRRYAEGSERPELRGVVAPLEEGEADHWWWYFASASTTGATWSPEGFAPVFQGMRLLTTERLVRAGTTVYPDLGQPWLGVGGTLTAPALTFGTDHPYARGFVVTSAGRRSELGLEEPVWRLDLTPGVHELTVEVRTDYAPAVASPVRVRMR